MTDGLTRRDVLKSLGCAGAGALLGVQLTPEAAHARGALTLRGRTVEIVVTPASASTVRITIAPLVNGAPQPVPQDGSLVRQVLGTPVARIASLSALQRVRAGDLIVTLSPNPLTVRVDSQDGRTIQQLHIDEATGTVTFPLGDGPVFGLGEGGPQFDRRGARYRMHSGQGGYELRTHGGRVPIPWLIGTAGWAMFIHHPYGTFDLTGADGRFAPGLPRGPRGAGGDDDRERPADVDEALPLDLFVVGAHEPTEVMREYARLTGYPEVPPLWAFGYQQSHRTITSRDVVMSVARTFREKHLPCDALIYLGTGFVPSGWNTANGSFEFNPRVFPDPQAMLNELHQEHFRVVLHAVILTRSLHGTVRDTCNVARFDDTEAACYWDEHRALQAMGVDGWWPDEGDALNPASRLTRIQMYWEGPQLDAPHVRPYALHRNGYAGMQRYAPFLWSGDVYSTWETLRTHVPNAINTSLTGIPYWGTDTGGFVPTKEFTAELYLRWFQFSAFCTLFRSHGRTWMLRLPWGWDTGELGPPEIRNYGGAADPDPSELHNPTVEPICRKYLELRYRLMPYLYTAVHEAHRTGQPIIRALWLHYPDDAQAVARGDEYLWGRDILVAPVTEAGAASRRLYLPRGAWYDFWTEQKADGGREVARPVDLATMPLYVRAGAIIPLGPVKQYTAERVDGPLSLVVYPGADGA
ncbi:MAG TPA: TIM-barrel domain-containing protein, partial [Gemmatimonadaceae bacterium]|nr:TIM-barrel domain-containing protein [Gemmatimonadaceae bacterium]